MASLDGLVPPTNGLTIGLSSMVDVFLSMEHQSILRCNQMTVQVAHTLLQLMDGDTGQQDLINFTKDNGLQSSTHVARNASVKLIRVVHRCLGPDIKGFLNDLNSTLQGAIDAEIEKNPYEAFLLLLK
ncbi:unnamed protein product [Sphagnum compactum]